MDAVTAARVTIIRAGNAETVKFNKANFVVGARVILYRGISFCKGTETTVRKVLANGDVRLEPLPFGQYYAAYSRMTFTPSKINRGWAENEEIKAVLID
jgi:hypothetical protein